MTSQVLSEQLSTAPVQAFVRLLQGHAAATRELSADLVRDHGLTINDYEALLRLSRADGHYLKRVELAESLVLTPSGVTRLLDGLERAGYVEKGSCDTDARITYAVLTEAGLEKLEEASRSHIAQIRAFFGERFDEDELATLAELLGRLPGAVGDGTDCAPPPE
jgi:DNA-binding MarR family transcriptional regulator